MSNGLTKQEIMVVVNRYIGVQGGYLGDFSYRTHSDFYPEFCDLDIEPDELEGTTRQRFIQILTNHQPREQAKIIRGTFDRFPLDAQDKPSTRTKELQDKLLQIAIRLETSSGVSNPSPKSSHDVVVRALQDAETLLKESRAASTVDRIFTALHGYMEAICNDARIAFGEDDSIVKLFKLIKEKHPAFQSIGPRGQDIVKVLRSLSAIIDALQPVRNKASLAHPNEHLLEQAEAMLVMNTTKTIMHYLDNRIVDWENQNQSTK